MQSKLGLIIAKILSFIFRANFKQGANMVKRIDLKGRGQELGNSKCKKLEKSARKLLQCPGGENGGNCRDGLK